MLSFTEPRAGKSLMDEEQNKKNEAVASDEEVITLKQAISEFPALTPFTTLPEAYLVSHKLRRYEAKKLDEQIKMKIVRPGSSVPMLCKGPSCSIRHLCSIANVQETGDMTYPLGCPCPIEATLVEFWRNDYYRSLTIDKGDKVERDRVEELLELDLTVWRINAVVSSTGYTVDNAVGVSNTGAPLFKKELNPLLEAKERASKRKDKILNELIATRDAKERSMIRKAKAQAIQNSNDWFKMVADRAVAAGVDAGGYKSPVEIALEEASKKQIDYKVEDLIPNGKPSS